MDVITRFWVSGIAIFLLYHLLQYIEFRKMVKRWQNPITRPEILTIFDQVCMELSIKKKPNILLCKKINSPMIFGVINPMVLLPQETYHESEMEFILRHEMIHLKRKDIWYKLVLLLTNAIHWFNPLVYMMVKSAIHDIELSCDYEVIRDQDLLFRKEYSQTILTTWHQGKQKQSIVSIFLNENKKTMKARFEYEIRDGAYMRTDI